MDQIKIKDLEVYANHGVLKEENVLGQKFLVTLCLECDTRTAGKSDLLQDSINYAEVSQFVVQFMKEHTFRLIEAAAEHLAEAVLLQFSGVSGVSLEIKKPWAPIRLPLDTVSVSISRGWHTAYLALGSNLGDKVKNMNRAVELLRSDLKIRVEKVSGFILTEPMGEVEQDDFLNGAVKIRTLYEPEELLDAVMWMETEMGRVRTIRWGPRTMDIDILLYDTVAMRTERLTIPHYGMQDRDFVLRPLEEIAPQAIHPLLQQTVYQLLQAWNQKGSLAGTQEKEPPEKA